MPEQINRYTYGEIVDYLYGYEIRQARANNRARMIMSAFCGEDPYKFWPLFTDEFEAEVIENSQESPQEALERFALILGAV